MLGITCVCTVYGSYHVNRDMMVGCIFMWLIFGILHVAFRTIYREDKGCLDDIRKNKYKISVMECISVNPGGEHVDTNFEYISDCFDSCVPEQSFCKGCSGGIHLSNIYGI